MIYLNYLEQLNKVYTNPLLDEMKNYAHLHHVPIIQDEGLELLIHIIEISKAKKVLEIGSAIGYSALEMIYRTGVHVTTIERDPEMITLAKENFKKSGKENSVTLIEGDAITLPNELFEVYDVIFIDAAKGKYIQFFEKYEKYLALKGVIFTDNLLFHDMVGKDLVDKNKRTRQLVSKINQFNEWVTQKEEYHTHIYEIGDGIALSYLK